MQSVKKRGKSVVTHNAENALTSSSDIIDSPDKLPSNLILHLKTIQKCEIETNVDDSVVKNVMSYNPSITVPSAYDPCDNVSFLNDMKKNLKLDEYHPVEEKMEKVKINTLCWWCCHKFDESKTIKMPIKKSDKASYECVGFFCSPECTCAYILDSGSKYGDKWKQFELLHEMLDVHHSIRPAPKKELLNVFGGQLDIDTFRGESQWHILYPPMVSLKLHMDDTPTSKDESLCEFDAPIHINTLQVDDIQIETLTDKKKKKSKKVSNNDTLDRFWGVEA